MLAVLEWTPQTLSACEPLEHCERLTGIGLWYHVSGPLDCTVGQSLVLDAVTGDLGK